MPNASERAPNESDTLGEGSGEVSGEVSRTTSEGIDSTRETGESAIGVAPSAPSAPPMMPTRRPSTWVPSAWLEVEAARQDSSAPPPPPPAPAPAAPAASKRGGPMSGLRMPTEGARLPGLSIPPRGHTPRDEFTPHATAPPAEASNGAALAATSHASVPCGGGSGRLTNRRVSYESRTSCARAGSPTPPSLQSERASGSLTARRGSSPRSSPRGSPRKQSPTKLAPPTKLPPPARLPPPTRGSPRREPRGTDRRSVGA